MLCIKRILIVPLAAVMLAALLAVTPTGSPNTPVLSTLQAGPADAHTDTRQATKKRFVCRWEYQHVRVIVGYEWGPYPIWSWKQELVEVCEWEYYTVTQNNPHFHITAEQCEDILVFVAAATVTAATRGRSGAGASGAAKQAGAGTATIAANEGAEAVGGNWVTRTVCKMVPRVIPLGWIP